MSYFVYILTNYKRNVLYIGVTNNIVYRVNAHKKGIGSAFTRRYQVSILVYTEEYNSVYDALEREKQLKRWHSEWKWNLIKEYNPDVKEVLL